MEAATISYLPEESERFAGVPTNEQETTINLFRDETAAEIWTSDRTMMTKLDRMCREAPDNYRMTESGRDRAGNLICKTYVVADKNLISFRSRKVQRELSEEQRIAMIERGKALRRAQLADSRDTGIPTAD